NGGCILWPAPETGPVGHERQAVGHHESGGLFRPATAGELGESHPWALREGLRVETVGAEACRTGGKERTCAGQSGRRAETRGTDAQTLGDGGGLPAPRVQDVDNEVERISGSVNVDTTFNRETNEPPRPGDCAALLELTSSSSRWQHPGVSDPNMHRAA